MFNIMQHKYSYLARVAAVILCLGLAATAEAGHKHLTGLWEITGTPSIESGVPEFVNLTLFGKDGELVNIDPSEGASIGSWKRIAHKTYSARFFGFIPLGPETKGRFEVNGTLYLGDDKSSLYGDFVTEVTLDGMPVFDFDGTISGIRL
jgi:hypothetical protein